MLDIQGNLAAYREGRKRKADDEESDRIAQQLHDEDEASAREEYHSQSLALL
jgi:hypothetical protein